MRETSRNPQGTARIRCGLPQGTRIGAREDLGPRADDGPRTRDTLLGRQVLYRLSYVRMCWDHPRLRGVMRGPDGTRTRDPRPDKAVRYSSAPQNQDGDDLAAAENRHGDDKGSEMSAGPP